MAGRSPPLVESDASNAIRSSAVQRTVSGKETKVPGA